MAQNNGQWNAITYGFKPGVPQAIDDRLVLTKEEMKAMADDRMPQNYIAVCTNDDKLYIYDKDASKDTETGRFRVYNESSVEGVQLNGVDVVDANKIAKIEIPFEVVDGKLCCKYQG